MERMERVERISVERGQVYFLGIEEKALVLDELLLKQTWTEVPNNDALHFDQANPTMQESNAKKIDLTPLMPLMPLMPFHVSAG